jgi:large subunit ribosomal protein L25
MTEIRELRAELRERTGKGGARAARRAGLVPAIVYGGEGQPQPIAVLRRDLDHALGQGGFMNALVDLMVGDGRERVLPRDVQFDVVKDWPVHVDFLRIGADAVIDIEVPVTFVNEESCVGLRRGGVLNIVRHSVEVHCRADAIPEEIVIDLAGYDIGDSIHISAVALPEGVRPTITGRDFTVATIAAPSVMREEAAVEGAAPSEVPATEVKEGGEEAGESDKD